VSHWSAVLTSLATRSTVETIVRSDSRTTKQDRHDFALLSTITDATVSSHTRHGREKDDRRIGDCDHSRRPKVFYQRLNAGKSLRPYEVESHSGSNKDQRDTCRQLEEKCD
jgi:hypothetical protein